MKIFLIMRGPFPNGMAATKRILCYAKGWMSKGIDCEVIVYTRTERYGDVPKNIVGKGTIENVKFLYIKGTPLREKNVLLRVFNDYYDNIRLINYLRNNLKHGDIVFAFDKPNMFTKALISMIHSKGGKYARELCELPFGTSVENESSKKKRCKFERDIMPKIDGVIAISEALADYAKAHCNPHCHIVKIPILVEFEKYRMANMSNEATAPYIFHCGTLYQQKDGFPDMLKAFGMASKELPSDVKFYSTGRKEGSRHESEINDIIEKYSLQDKVVFLGYLSDDEIKDYLSKARFVIINKLTTQQNKYCFSTKLGEYMAASKPIITTQVGEAMNWLKHERDAYIIPPDNVESLKDAIKKMFIDNELCERLGLYAQQTCLECFSIESNADKLRNFAFGVTDINGN